MSVNSSRARLVALTGALMGRWRETRTQWPDAKGAEFERRYLAPLEDMVASVAPKIEDLDVLLGKVRDECE